MKNSIMKKLLFISFALAFFWGCEKVDSDVPVKDDEVIEGETPDKEETDTLLTDYVLPDILYASMSGEDEDDPETRTHVDKGVVLWQNGDAVSYFAGNIHNARYSYTGEKHDFWELVYVDKGELEVAADYEGYKLKEGDIIFHKPNEFHNLWANGISAPNVLVISFVCHSPMMSFFENKIMIHP